MGLIDSILPVIKNIKKRGFKDILNPKKWFVFTKSKVQQFTGVKLEKEEVLSYSEQLVYRSIVCSECFRLKACIDCSCPQPDAGIVKESYCSLGRYGTMLSSEKWEEFKLKNKIKGFKIYYNE